jgi:hypothetical protein
MTTQQTSIYVKTHFIGFHHWPGAPQEVSFLRNLHRHIFNVRVAVWVDHSNRDVEFFILKNKVTTIIGAKLLPLLVSTPSMSCEMMAEFLLDCLRKTETYKVRSVEVNEDGENGAVLEVTC